MVAWACAVAPAALWSARRRRQAAPSTSPLELASAASDDPLGPLVDVTADWQDYQPSTDFCIKPDVVDYPAAQRRHSHRRQPGVRRPRASPPTPPDWWR